ncbi:MAG: hypothetical protein N4A33_05640 [Bacteriovoracaceae bacterium]|jgi:hypothetical protein|nr:hypothetical protein [Bacteriovoracaceae bacterium]
MRNLLIGLFMATALTCYANSDRVVIVKERNSNREIHISYETNQDKQNDIVFSLKDRNISLELNRIPYEKVGDTYELYGGYNTYNFKLAKIGFEVTEELYRLCWKESSVGAQLTTFGGFIGLSAIAIPAATPPAMFAIIGGTIGICGALPAVPALVLGVALLPVDALISGVASIYHHKAIANRKMRKAMIKGKSKKASKRVFNLILDRINML